MEMIREHFLQSTHQYWLSVEIDVIVPSYILDYIKPHVGVADILTVPYREREGDELLEHSFGCTVFSRKFLEHESFNNAPSDVSTDGWLFRNKIFNRYQFKVLRGALVPEHLKG
jgi:hypothetical protein